MENIGNAIFEGLNDEQREAVSCVDGPVLIVAGAGAGKTRVLTSRIALLVGRGVDPSRVMALTFTKKAANEMKERIALMVGKRCAWRLRMGTFHSIFVRFLREYSQSLGYPSNFTIYDTGDSVSAVKACIKELGLDDKVYKPKDVLARISLAKNNLVTDVAYRNNRQALEKDMHSRKPRICDIYSLYASKCRNSGVMDFDDILLNMNILLRDNPEAKLSLASRFDYILVDEYQDTNFAQYLILKKLTEIHRNICVVGDDSQSIYAFRGAKIENILNFRKDYPECKVFRLEKNYRSTANIVNAANSLIAKNENRIPKNCVAVGGTGEMIRILCSFSEQEEALRIASEIIARMQQDHAKYQDFAILYRTNSQSRALEEALRKRNLPYVIYSGNSFFERSEVKDMMAYFKLVVNIHDDESFKRVVNMPSRGIGDTSLGALAAMARDLGTSMFKAAYSEKFAEYGLKAPAVARIRSFCDMIGTFAAKTGNTDASELAAALSDACGLHAHFKSDPSIESQSRASNVEELLNSVTAFIEERQNEYLQEIQEESQIVDESEVTFPLVTLGEFLENISLLTAVDSTDEEDARNRVALMTAHSAKGLEFPYVFVAGMEENLFPSGGMLSTPTDIEEERRLFYVAMTRAKEAVYLSYAQTRMRNGKHESNSPSRFLREIDPAFIANPLRKEEPESSLEDDEDYPFRRSFSGFGSRRGGFRGSGTKVSGFRTGNTAASKPPVSPASRTIESLRNRPLPPKIPDEEFIPVPMTELKAGQRIEHNRFGFGRIMEITGSVPDLKAKIVFDGYGEKILLLKYAKIRLG
ncbi:MAG: UvrD-helicase domain-containing protein [Bacteroidales bacterium]|nr:UvrD-helicase domain-containing protein [Bacteroidales bacterium]